MFLLSLILLGGALVLVFRGRARLNESFQAWHGGDREAFAPFSNRGGWFIYPAWALAAGGAACLFVSHRRRERAWRWIALVLLLLFLVFGLAPV